LPIDGKKVYATGTMILAANLAMIVIRDGRFSPPLPPRDPDGPADQLPRPRALVFAMTRSLGRWSWMLGLMSFLTGKINYATLSCFVVLGYGISSDIHIEPVSGNPLGHVRPSSYRGRPLPVHASRPSLAGIPVCSRGTRV